MFYISLVNSLQIVVINLYKEQVMREMIKRISTLITFDLPLQRDYITERFKTVHDFQQIEVPL